MCNLFGQEIPAGHHCGDCDRSQACMDAYLASDTRPVSDAPLRPLVLQNEWEAEMGVEPDPDALDFALLIKLGMSPQEAAEVKDAEGMTFAEWQAAYVDAF